MFVLEFFELHPEGLIPLLPCIIMLTKQFVIFETFPIWSVLKLIALPQWTNIIEKSLFVFNNRYQQYLSPFTNATCIFDIKRWIKNNSQIKPPNLIFFVYFVSRAIFRCNTVCVVQKVRWVFDDGVELRLITISYVLVRKVSQINGLWRWIGHHIHPGVPGIQIIF